LPLHWTRQDRIDISNKPPLGGRAVSGHRAILFAGVSLLMLAFLGALPFMGLANCSVDLAGVRLFEQKAGQASGQAKKAAALACGGETALGVLVAAGMAVLLCASLLLLTV